MTGDEAWIYHRSIKSKQSSTTWYAAGEAPATVVRRSEFERKHLVAVFFRTTGPESIHLIECGKSITDDYYQEFCWKPLFNNIKRKRPRSSSHGLKLHHDNDRHHQKTSVRYFVEEQGVLLMRRPPYSLDLVPSDFWFFGHSKRQLGTYSDANTLQKAVTKELRAIGEDEYRKTFTKWIDRMKLCISNYAVKKG